MGRLTIKEAAKYYGKSESWIRKRILNEQLEAEKESFTYGERWITTEEALDDLAKRLNQTAKTENEVVEVRQVDRPVNKEKLINELVEATESRNKKLINEAVEKISEQFKQRDEQIKQQGELLNKIYKKVDRVEKKQDKSLFDKIKQLFK